MFSSLPPPMIVIGAMASGGSGGGDGGMSLSSTPKRSAFLNKTEATAAGGRGRGCSRSGSNTIPNYTTGLTLAATNEANNTNTGIATNHYRYSNTNTEIYCS